METRGGMGDCLGEPTGFQRKGLWSQAERHSRELEGRQREGEGVGAEGGPGR